MAKKPTIPKAKEPLGATPLHEVFCDVCKMGLKRNEVHNHIASEKHKTIEQLEQIVASVRIKTSRGSVGI